MTLRRFFVLLVLLLAACQPVPQPFKPAEKGANVLHELKDTFGVALTPCELPAPVGPQIDAAMLSAFEQADVPAHLGQPGQRNFRVQALCRQVKPDPARSEVRVTWSVTAPDGKPLAEVQDAAPLIGSVLLQSQADALAQRTVATLLPFVTDPAVEAVAHDTVVVWGIDGAPGDGKTGLKTAMETVLQRNGVTLGDPKRDGSTLVLGSVEVTPPANGKQEVTIRWSVLRPDGREVGTATQNNKIKAGSLDGSWGEVALLIAQAAYDGIAPLLKRGQQDGKP